MALEVLSELSKSILTHPKSLSKFMFLGRVVVCTCPSSLIAKPFKNFFWESRKIIEGISQVIHMDLVEDLNKEMEKAYGIFTFKKDFTHK